MTQTTTFNDDGSMTISGRELKPLYKKLNPIWWFMNDEEQTVDEAPWYLPDRPYVWRWIMWNVFRNPLQNFRAFVIGVQDRNYTVRVTEGNPNPLVIQRNDVGELGWQKARLEFPSGRTLPWTSYSGKRIVAYWGWQPMGFAGVKFNLTKEAPQ